MPVSLTEEAVKEKSSGGLLSNIHFMHHVKIEDLVMFCRQMYSLTKAGIPLLRAIGGLSNTITNPVLRDELKQIGRDLAGGMPMAYSLRNRPDIFSPLFVALINVGENTGELEGSFKQIAEYLSLDMETRKRVKAAIRYPMIVIIFLASRSSTRSSPSIRGSSSRCRTSSGPTGMCSSCPSSASPGSG